DRRALRARACAPGLRAAPARRHIQVRAAAQGFAAGGAVLARAAPPAACAPATSFGIMHPASCREDTMRGGTGCLLLLLAGAAQADQYSYVSAQRAAQAVQRLAGRVLVQVYCAPCAETRPRTLRLEQVGMERVWDGTSAQPCRAPDGATYWQVQ